MLRVADGTSRAGPELVAACLRIGRGWGGDRERQPASTMVQVGMLTRDGALYEVEAVAVLPPA
jgi:enamine deaminase RidA (YjgF/YER057c/UK114 family)